MIRVKATREGLIGQMTSTGWIITPYIPYVALPASAARHKNVHIINPLNGKECYAVVLDTGPHHTDDYDYVFGGQRPLAETDAKSNGAGIDLGEYVWNALGMLDNTEVDWEFV